MSKSDFPGNGNKPKQASQAAKRDSTSNPIFKAAKRLSDSKTPAVDLILQVAVTIALEAPGRGIIGMKWQGGSDGSKLTIATLIKALHKRHLSAIDSHGNRKEMPAIARELIVDVVANKADWKPYSNIFAAFALRNDQDFFERLARGLQRKRMHVFNNVDLFCLLNWNEWNDVPLPDLEKFPPLKFWTDESVLSLLEVRFGSEEKDARLKVPGLRTKRGRLGLEQSKPPGVTGLFPAMDGTGRYIIKTPD